MRLIINKHAGMKRVICFILMILVMVLTLFVQYQECYAFAPAIALGGVALVAAVGLLIAAGCLFPTTASAEQSANAWYTNLVNIGNISTYPVAENPLQSFINFYENTSNIKIIDDVLWQNVRNWVNSNYNVGSNTQLVNKTTDFIIGTDLLYQASWDGAPHISIGQDVTMWGNNYTVSKYSTYGNTVTWRIYKNGVYTNFLETLPNMNPFFYIDVNTTNFVILGLQFTNIYNELKTYSMDGEDANVSTSIFYNDVMRCRDILNTRSQSCTVTGDIAVDNPIWDIPKTAEGERAISIPATLDDCIGLTWDDVIEQEVPTTAPTTGDIADTSGDINWEPLKLVGTVFTDRFPFSLPWDLLRSFTTLSGNTGDPDFSIAVPDTKLLKGFAFNVDLSIFDNLVQVAKAFELLAFDIGLILVTRKLLGGAV